MTLDSAITYYEEIAKDCRRKADIERNDYMDMRDSASEAEQLASWLNELKLLRGRIDAQPERKTGRWIERNPQNSPDCRLIECSECGNAYIVGYNIDYDDWIDGRDFCMRCGADLRGGSNGKNT